MMHTIRYLILLQLFAAFGLCLGCQPPPSPSEQYTDASDTPEQPVEAAPPGPLRVKAMSFNIRNGVAFDGKNAWIHRKKLVLDVGKREGGDFIGMQEAWKFQIDAFANEVTAYKCIGRSRDKDPETGEWCALCYKHERWLLDEKDNGTFWLSETPEQVASKSWGSSLPRIVTWARFTEKSSGRGIYIYNTHYDHRSSSARYESSKLIVKKIQQRKRTNDPFILMGDFNAGESNQAVSYLKGKTVGKDTSPLPMVDTFRVLHPNDKEVGTFNGWTGNKKGSKIDYIMVQKQEPPKVLDARILHDNEKGQYPSDHFPLIAELEYPAPK